MMNGAGLGVSTFSNDDLIQLGETLSDAMHRLRNNWMQALFDNSIENEDGSITIPANHVHYMKMLNVPWDELNEIDKHSSRIYASGIINVVISMTSFLNEEKEFDYSQWITDYEKAGQKT